MRSSMRRRIGPADGAPHARPVSAPISIPGAVALDGPAPPVPPAMPHVTRRTVGERILWAARTPYSPMRLHNDPANPRTPTSFASSSRSPHLSATSSPEQASARTPPTRDSPIGVFGSFELSPPSISREQSQAVNRALTDWIDQAGNAIQRKDRKRAGKKILDAVSHGDNRLDLSAGHLDSLPDCFHLMDQLRELHLEHNRITTLPENWPLQMQKVYLHENPISVIPLAVTEANPHCTFTFSRRDLSQESRDTIAIQAVVRSAFPGEAPALTLMEYPPVALRLSAWQAAPALIAAHCNRDCPDGPARRSYHRAFWQKLAAQAEQMQVSPNPVLAFSDFLLDLRDTASNSSANGQTSLRDRIDDVIDPIASDATLREICFGIVSNAAGECVDRRTNGLDAIELAVLSHRVSQGDMSIADLLDHARQVQTLEELDCFAKTVCGPQHHELLEIVLALRVQLGDALRLPIISRRMQYGQFARQLGLTPALVEEAHLQVQANLADPEREIAFLADWAPWTTHLRQRYPEEFARAAAEHSAAVEIVHERLAALDSDRDALTSGQYMAEARALHEEFAGLDQRTGLPMRLRLTAAELKCFRDG